MGQQGFRSTHCDALLIRTLDPEPERWKGAGTQIYELLQMATKLGMEIQVELCNEALVYGDHHGVFLRTFVSLRLNGQARGLFRLSGGRASWLG